MSAELEKIAGQLDRIVEILELLHKIKERERERFPKTFKEKGKETSTNNNNNPRARACEKFVKPTLEEVADYIRENGFTFDAVHFWNFYESNGWRVGYRQMKSWRSACVTWQKNDDKRAARAAHIDAMMAARAAHLDAKMDERTAHIDAKMDERERKREAKRSSGGGSRKPSDNYIKPTEADLEEVRRDFAF